MRITSLCMTYFFSQVKQKWLTSLVEEKKTKQNKTKKEKKKRNSDERSHRKGFSEDERFLQASAEQCQFQLKKLRSPTSINPVHVKPGIKVEMFDA